MFLGCSLWNMLDMTIQANQSYMVHVVSHKLAKPGSHSTREPLDGSVGTWPQTYLVQYTQVNLLLELLMTRY
jgi:hypothetical protein